MAFCWRAVDGPLLVLFVSSFPSSKKKERKNVVRVGPPLANVSGSAHAVLSQPSLLVFINREIDKGPDQILDL